VKLNFFFFIHLVLVYGLSLLHHTLFNHRLAYMACMICIIYMCRIVTCSIR